MTDDIRKLLGGYATGTLTQEERSALYHAALEDAALFEALADEQALRDLLEDSAARAQILEAVEDRKFSIAGGFRDWFERPKAKVLSGLAVALLVIIAFVHRTQNQSPDQYAIRVDRRAITGSVPPPDTPAPASRAVREHTREQHAAPKRRTAEPAIDSPAAAPASPPSEQNLAAEAKQEGVTQVASAETGEIRYTLLLRTAEGSWNPVAADYAFSADDRARLRIETNSRGTLLVTATGSKRTLFAGTVSALAPVLVPNDLTFDSQPESLDVVFTPLPATAVSMAFTARPDQPSPGAVGGVVGGVPDGVTSGALPPKLDRRATTPARKQSAAVNEITQKAPATVTIHIELRRK